jgi:hypothetical protein
MVADYLESAKKTISFNRKPLARVETAKTVQIRVRFSSL